MNLISASISLEEKLVLLSIDNVKEKLRKCNMKAGAKMI